MLNVYTVPVCYCTWFVPMLLRAEQKASQGYTHSKLTWCSDSLFIISFKWTSVIVSSSDGVRNLLCVNWLKPIVWLITDLEILYPLVLLLLQVQGAGESNMFVLFSGPWLSHLENTKALWTESWDTDNAEKWFLFMTICILWQGLQFPPIYISFICKYFCAPSRP